MNNRKTLAVLQNLIATCRDGEQGYKRVMESMAPGDLKGRFGAQAEQRARFAAELLAEAHRLDTAQEQQGSVAGVLHRGWMKVEEFFTHKDSCKAIVECERGERAALKRYARALQLDMPAEIRDIVGRQYASLKEAYEHVHSLRVLEVLRDLMRICASGENGYRTAVKEILDGATRDVLDSYSQQRGQFADEIAAEMQRLGAQVQRKGTTAAALHRGWMKIKAAATVGRPRTILRECQRGERIALRHYERALKAELPAKVRGLVQRQHDQVKEACERLHTLEVG